MAVTECRKKLCCNGIAADDEALLPVQLADCPLQCDVEPEMPDRC